MSQQDFIIWVFCWVDDNLTQLQQGTRLRSRGYHSGSITVASKGGYYTED
ncbi:hypothetical protein [Xenorhabdus sp. BG5]|nr:hypothetical protein [Xenorhabdus sp. BG5]